MKPPSSSKEDGMVEATRGLFFAFFLLVLLILGKEREEKEGGACAIAFKCAVGDGAP